MSKAAWLLALVAVLALGHIASAQSAPAVAPVSSSTVQAQAVTQETAPDLDLSQIFGSPSAPEPMWTSCTMTQCKQPCRQECIDAFCTPVCVNLSTCICGCSCP